MRDYSPTKSPPAPVTGVVAVAESSSSIKISWNVSPETDVVGYRITRKTGMSYSEISKVTTPSFVDSGLDAMTEYCYRADAYDAANNYSSPSSEACATTKVIPTVDTLPPVTVASPQGGTYTSAQNISLTCTDTGGSGCSKTYFTVDGSEPTIASPAYASAIAMAANTTLKFFSVDNQGNVEATKTANYSVVLPQKTVLEVVKNDASGLVTSSVAGINCGVTCTAEYVINTDVVLTATHSAGLTPIWSGCASTNANQCMIKMDRTHRIAVAFAVMVAESASNDTFETAQLIPASSIVSGYYNAANDVDFYRIVVTQQSTLQATLSHATVSSYLVLFNELKTQITYTSGMAHTLTQSLSPGTYYLKIYPAGGYNLTVPYDLKLTW